MLYLKYCMNCKNCGNEIPEGAKFCTGCGAGIADANGAVALTEKEQKSVNGWSWGAFFGSWIFLFLNKQYSLGWKFFGIYVIVLFLRLAALFGFINYSVASGLGGILGLILFGLAIWLSIKGRQIVWKSGVWSTFEAFKKRQRLVTKVNILYILITVVISVGTVFMMVKPMLANPALMDERVMQQALSDEKTKNPDVNDAEFAAGYQAGSTDSTAAVDTAPTFLGDKSRSFMDGYGYGYMVTCMGTHDNEKVCIDGMMSKFQ